MTNLIARFVHEDEGQVVIEYGMLIGRITAGIVAAIVVVGPKVAGYYTALKTALGA